MKKNILLINLFITSLVLSSCSVFDEEKHVHSYTVKRIEENYLKEKGNCEHKSIYYYSCECGKCGTDTFEYGQIKNHSVNANYICDMICPDCGATIKKLEPTNEYLELLDSQDYKDDAYKFYNSLSKIYSFIDASKNDETGEHMMNIIMGIVNALDTLNEAYDNLHSNYAEYMYSLVRGTEKDIEEYNELLQIQEDIDKQSNLYVAHLFFSPLKSVFFEESDYESMEPYLQEILDAQLNGEEYVAEEQELSNDEKRLNELKTLISSQDTTLETRYSLLGEYITLANELNSGAYSNAYENSFVHYYKGTRTVKEEDEFRKNLVDYLIFDNSDVHKFSFTTSFTESEKHNLVSDVFKNEDVLQNLVAYFKTLDNGEINLFDKANIAFKEGRVLKFAEANVSCNMYNAIVFNVGHQSGGLSFCHEFGHWFVNYYTSSLSVAEFTSTANEAIYSAYLANKMEKGSQEYNSLVKNIIYYFLASALESAYIDEYARCIYARYSDIDAKYQDGISDSEIIDFTQDLNEKYGYERTNEYIINKAINYSLSSFAYNISYSNNYISSIVVFLLALDNYQETVNNYINFLYNAVKDPDTNDYYVPTLLASNFKSPFEESTFSYISEAISNYTK